MEEIKVSVIVPVYKVEEYLPACLNSLVEQSLEEIEIVAVNDGSPDSCGEILERYRKAYPDKIRVYEKENGGLSDARNFGLDRACGKYIAFLDSDDTVDPNLYQALYEKAEKTGADAVACDILYVWQDGRQEKIVSSGFPEWAEKEALKPLFTRFYPAVWNKLYRREVLLKSGVRFQKGVVFEDVEFSHRLFPYFRSVSSVHKVYLHYLQREGSITAKPDRRLFDYLKNAATITRFFHERELFPFWEKELEYAVCRYLLATFLTRAAKLAKKDFDEAVRESLAFLRENFPQWRKNPYFRKNGARGIYLRLFSPTLCRLLAGGR